MKAFTCPCCGIEQHDVYIEEGYLLSRPDDCTTFFHCNSCREILLPSDAPQLATVKRQILLREVLKNLAFWIAIVLLALH